MKIKIYITVRTIVHCLDQNLEIKNNEKIKLYKIMNEKLVIYNLDCKREKFCYVHFSKMRFIL